MQITVKLFLAYSGNDTSSQYTSFIIPGLTRPPVATTTFEASKTAEIVEKTKAFATEYGGSCYAMVQLPRGARKPPGFKAATSGLTFNLVPEPAVGATT